MSKRKRIPPPFNRVLPAVIRTFGPRFVLIAGGAAMLLVLLSGGSYILSQVNATPNVPAHKKPHTIPSPSLTKAQVLGDETTTSNAPATQQPPSSNSSGPATPTSTQTQSQETQDTASATQATIPSHEQAEGDDQSETGTDQTSRGDLNAHTGASLHINVPLGLSLNVSLLP